MEGVYMELRIPGIYSYKVVSAHLWAMQAVPKWGGNFVMSTVEAKLTTKLDNISPKCWEAFQTVKSNVK